MGFLANALASYPARAPVASSAPKPAIAGRDLAAIVALVRADERRRSERMRTGRDEAWTGIVNRTIGVRLRWSPQDRERIISQCEAGDFYALGMFLDAMRTNGTVYGIMSTRRSMLRLPIQWTGDPFLVESLRGRDPEYDARTGALIDPGHASDFMRQFPLTELGAIHWDGDLGGIGLGEFVPDESGQPRLRHLNVHWIRYDYTLCRYIYQTPLNQYEIRPGDGRWFLYTPYGRERPHTRAPWLACALPFIEAHTAALDRLRWQGDLADALKLIRADKDRPDPDLEDFDAFARNDWHRSPHLVLRTTEAAELVESNGKGYEVFSQTGASAKEAIAQALAGQTATSGQGASWSKGNIWADIAQSIVGESAERMADTVHEQGLQPYARARGRKPHVWIKWDVRSPEQRTADAEVIGKIADSVQKADAVYAARGKRVDLKALLDQNGLSLPFEDLPEDSSAANVKLDIAPNDLALVLGADEIRTNRGLKPWGGERGSMTLGQLKAESAAPANVPPQSDETNPQDASIVATALRASAEYEGEIPIHERRIVEGMSVVIDRPAGTVQTGLGPDGPWSRTFVCDYGYFENYIAPDGDGVDVYIYGNGVDYQSTGYAFVIQQVRRDGSPDEPKVMLGFQSQAEAVIMYLRHTPEWCFGEVDAYTIDDLRSYLTELDEACRPSPVELA